MTRPLTFIASVVVVAALVAPSAAAAQATRRGGSDSGSSSGSGGGARGGSDSGSSGGAVAVPRNSSPQPSSSPAPVTRERPSRPASVAGEARRTASRPAAVSDTRPTPGVRAATPSSAAMRIRGAQATRGVAQPRTNAITPPQQFPSSRGYRWSPWYGYGYGYSYGPGSFYGHAVYDPWFGGGPWGWSRYRWHDPFLFDPYGYVGFTPYYWPSADLGRDENIDQGVVTGSLRLRVSPSHARVYVDGALAGVAGEFGGLSNHLVLPAGVHELELRAEGYTSQTVQVEIRGNRTQTERISLEKQ